MYLEYYKYKMDVKSHKIFVTVKKAIQIWKCESGERIISFRGWREQWIPFCFSVWASWDLCLACPWHWWGGLCRGLWDALP